MKKNLLLISLIISISLNFVLLTLLYFKCFRQKTTIAFNARGADTLLIDDLTSLLNKKGYYATRYEYKSEIDCKNIDYNIEFRGRFEYFNSCTNAKHNILWLFYADLDKINGIEKKVTIDEYLQEIIKAQKDFDALIVSSKKIYDLLKDKLEISIYYIPQFTNPKKFYYEFDKDKKSKILFVGHPHFHRVAPVMALKNNLPINIFGEGWNSYIGENINGYDIPHGELHQFYSSAGIVLGDTMPGMREFGFIPNRVYDVSASGGFIISDYIEEIEKVYGDAIPMWKNEKEFLEIIDYYLKHPEKRIEKIKIAKKITLKNYTINKACNNLIKVIKKTK